MDESNLVELTKANSAFEAHAIRGFLESHNIPCFIADERMVNMLCKASQTDVRINVHQKDLNTARDLLETL